MSTTLSPETTDEKPSAVVFQFPDRMTQVRAEKAKAKEAQALTVSNDIDPQARLANALASLNAALAQQKKAVADYRATIAELATTMQGLHGSMTSFQDKLGEIKQTADSAHATSLETIKIIDDAEGRKDR